jgi:hypothetical protein
MVSAFIAYITLNHATEARFTFLPFKVYTLLEFFSPSPSSPAAIARTASSVFGLLGSSCYNTRIGQFGKKRKHFDG